MRIERFDLQLRWALGSIGKILPRHQRVGIAIERQPIDCARGPFDGQHQLESAILCELQFVIAGIGEDGVAAAAKAVHTKRQIQLIPAPAPHAIAEARIQRGAVVERVGVVHVKLARGRHDLHKARPISRLFHLELRHRRRDAC